VAFEAILFQLILDGYVYLFRVTGFASLLKLSGYFSLMGAQVTSIAGEFMM
jgi:hypothetical protein